MTSFSQKHLLGLRFLSTEDIKALLDQTTHFKDVLSRPNKQVPVLRGKTILSLFFEPSTRTKVSFETAIKSLGASVVSVNVESSSVKKGESLYDTIQNLQAMGLDAIVMRHKLGGAPYFVSQFANVPVINAGDGYHEHPTQGLLDVFTMQEKCGDLAGKIVLICGDILHSRVARSNIWALTRLGATVWVSGPPTLVNSDIERMGAKIMPLDEAVKQADVINVLRVQFERQEGSFFPSVREYREFFSLTEERFKTAKSNVVIMHPGPMNRGIEVDSSVADSPNNVILEQVTNGIAVRMAVLYSLLAQQQPQA